ncbi:MAG: DMT family transporter [Candidatus Cloacimonadales bacterium]|jgi:drug/metabolite transporter (DMT)-like permease|nr:DMT family transporter [Candidatus Cloacimonadota bacterium]MDD2650355.1 DMT family transporter [Candidatus Cloacimonadota bacterium]MDD3500830.1 DMT family transporter [Candidatus Cloacimonadota bacterium]MDX9976835.1 DMT family transporter [Candidatus Cloacimonadales bacterium]
MKKNSILPHIIAICIAASLWGVDGVILTPKLYQLDVSFVVFIIHFIPFVLMSIFLFKEYEKLKYFTKQDFFLFTLLAIAGGSLGTLSIVKALFLVNFQKLTIVVLLQKLQPVFAITLSIIFLKEKVNIRFIIWASVAVIAAYIMAFGFELPEADFSNNAIKAYLYAAAAALFFASGTVISRKIATRHSFHTATFYRYGFTTLFMLLIVSSFGTITNITQATFNNWIVIVIISLTVGSGAIFLYYFGMLKVKASVATICELFFPLTAVILDLILHGNQLTIIQWFATALLIISILAITKSNVTKETKLL